MKRLFKGHFFLGRLASRTDDEFIGCLNQSYEVAPIWRHARPGLYLHLPGAVIVLANQ